METKTLLSGLAGFFIGGLIVSVAATTFEKPDTSVNRGNNEMSMSEMTTELKNKTGDDYDKAFITSMIAHHQGAVDMARLSAQNAKHDEIKKLSADIIAAQESEIGQMRAWQKDWGYMQPSPSSQTDRMDH